LEKAIKVFGKHHPNTLNASNVLAYIQLWRGYYGEAEGLFRQISSGREAVLGAKHPSTLKSFNGLAKVIELQGDYETALGYYERVYLTRCELFGKDKLSTIHSENNLAFCLSLAGQYQRAENFFEDSLKRMSALKGASHHETFRCEANYAFHLNRNGLRQQAISRFRHIFARWQENESKPWLMHRERFATVLAEDPSNQEAAEMFQDVLVKSRVILGESHNDTLKTMTKLCTLSKGQGKAEKAKTLAQEHLRLVTLTFPEDKKKIKAAKLLLATMTHS